MTVNKWWTERKSTFDGVPITYYDWPRDRMLVFTTHRKKTEFGYLTSSVIVPVFSLQETNSSLDELIRISLKRVSNTDNINPHIMLAKIEEHNDLYAICIFDGLYEVTVDFYEYAMTRTNDQIQQRKRPRFNYVQSRDLEDGECQITELR